MTSLVVPKDPGIYIVTNIVTNTYYIGQSSNVKLRWFAHKNLLANNKASNDLFQADWNKYGPDKFTFEYLHKLSEAEYTPETLTQVLTKLESFYITTYIEEGKKIYNLVLNPSESCWPQSQYSRSKRGKRFSGDGNNQAKLTEQQAICLLTTDSILTYKEAVEKYNVTKACIKDLWQRRSWAHLKYPKVMKEDDPVKRSGENHPFGKLKEAEAIAILTTDKLLTIKECAEKYHVTRIVIEQLRRRKTWKQLDLPEVNTKSTVKCTGTNNKSSKLNEDAVRDIRKRLENKESCISIGKLYGVSNVTISNIRDKKIWTHVI
jgi:group I intron endonuclease